jgi:hypothetical protein
MIRLSLSDGGVQSWFVSLKCCMHCTPVQFATSGGCSPLSAALSPLHNTKGQVWPSGPPPNSPLIMLFRSHWHHEYWSDDWNNDADSCVNYCLILFPHPYISVTVGQVWSGLDKLQPPPPPPLRHDCFSKSHDEYKSAYLPTKFYSSEHNTVE